jgi:hypothetical protein
MRLLRVKIQESNVCPTSAFVNKPACRCYRASSETCQELMLHISSLLMSGACRHLPSPRRHSSAEISLCVMQADIAVCLSTHQSAGHRLAVVGLLQYWQSEASSVRTAASDDNAPWHLLMPTCCRADRRRLLLFAVCQPAGADFWQAAA